MTSEKENTEQPTMLKPNLSLVLMLKILALVETERGKSRNSNFYGTAIAAMEAAATLLLRQSVHEDSGLRRSTFDLTPWLKPELAPVAAAEDALFERFRERLLNSFDGPIRAAMSAATENALVLGNLKTRQTGPAAERTVEEG